MGGCLPLLGVLSACLLTHAAVQPSPLLKIVEHLLEHATRGARGGASTAHKCQPLPYMVLRHCNTPVCMTCIHVRVLVTTADWLANWPTTANHYMAVRATNMPWLSKGSNLLALHAGFWPIVASQQQRHCHADASILTCSSTYTRLVNTI